MVFTFKCSDPRYEIYMGRDKFENEELIAHGWQEDIWFHVDKLSSAHVYLRTPAPEHAVQDEKQYPDLAAIPQKVLDEVAQLTKANSIEGCKQPQVDIVYTAWSNLRKGPHMDIGQVGFKDEKRVRHIKHVAKDRELLKAIEKTQQEPKIDLKAARERRDKEQIQKRKHELRQKKLAEEEEARKKEEERQLRCYASLQNVEPEYAPKGDGTIESCRAIEEDFL
ncbi:CCDC25 protein [Besnoitia besnoiti]|uniref:CCDC25 protein n=1 Tax=Besnoitia besnoiti TaxID=94643 RepID=A0A2A9M918_BESBE|nr:CCDC25 protein [Besnoitia besnoiti]PFH34978.1 CCDC25 protein [Besnoitia besnoiti]